MKIIALLLLAFTIGLRAQYSGVLTYHNENLRTGWTQNETSLSFHQIPGSDLISYTSLRRSSVGGGLEVSRMWARSDEPGRSFCAGRCRAVNSS